MFVSLKVSILSFEPWNHDIQYHKPYLHSFINTKFKDKAIKIFLIKKRIRSAIKEKDQSDGSDS